MQIACDEWPMPINFFLNFLYFSEKYEKFFFLQMSWIYNFTCEQHIVGCTSIFYFFIFFTIKFCGDVNSDALPAYHPAGPQWWVVTLLIVTPLDLRYMNMHRSACCLHSLTGTTWLYELSAQRTCTLCISVCVCVLSILTLCFYTSAFCSNACRPNTSVESITTASATHPDNNIAGFMWY